MCGNRPEADMSNADETAILELIEAMTAAWRRGSAKAYGARYQADATFTNVFGDFYVGRQDFDRRHEEVFAGIFKDTTLSMQVRKLRLLRGDVAVADIVTTLAGAKVRPPGVEVGADGALHSALLMVLTKEQGQWEIAAYHNVWQSAGR
jgi:uncharacterized protein (TIGR02246 family)